MLTILIRLLAVFAMVSMGVVARRRNFLDANGTRQLSLIVTNILYPALVYSSLVRSFTLSDLIANWALPAGTLLIMSCGFAVGTLAVAVGHFSSTRRSRAFRFQCTINNYVFLPMPLVMMFMGSEGVALLVFSTVGSELAVWTLGVVALTGRKITLKGIRHLISVPMVAIAAATATLALGHGTGWTWPEGALVTQVHNALMSVLDIFGKGTIPLAMMVAGSRMAELRLSHLRQSSHAVLLGLRLIVIPALAVTLLVFLPFREEARMVLVIVAVMPSSIASVMLSEIYEADSEFAATAVLLTHVASLLTIPLWLSLLQ